MPKDIYGYEYSLDDHFLNDEYGPVHTSLFSDLAPEPTYPVKPVVVDNVKNN